LPPIRANIQQTFKDFPWSYSNQDNVLMAYADLLLAGRSKSWNSYARLGIEEFTVRNFQYALLKSELHLQLLKEHIISKFGKIDRRQAFTVGVDDTSSQRYGEKVFGASIHYDHTGKGFQYGNVVVDFSVSSLTYLNNGYKVYLSKRALQKEVGNDRDLETKIELAYQIFSKQVPELLHLGISPKQIYCTSDSWFGCQLITDRIRELGANFILGTKKSATCNLFGNQIRMEELFKPDDPWKLRTNPKSNKDIYYQEKIINMTTLGKCKVFAIKRGQEKNIRYYATNNLKLTINTFLKKRREHWSVETLHDNIKNYMGFNDCYSGREIINLSHWNFVYLLDLIFRYYQLDLKRNDEKLTIFQLWETYCLYYDISRSKKCFRSKGQIGKAKKRLVSGWC